LGDGSPNEAAHERAVEITVATDPDVADELSGTLETAIRIGE
jgi:hypothetical protein